MLPGIRNVEDVKNLLGFFDVLPEERDYSVVGTFTPGEGSGELRVLQPLSALSCGPECGTDQ